MKKYFGLCIMFTAFLMFVLTGCSQSDENNGRIPVKVLEVVDGDTIHVEIDGKEETVRFLLVDTPESVHPNKPVQPFSKEASHYTKDLLSKSSDVELELGIGERDKYGRLLAYVYADGKSVQEALLEKGLARVAYVFEPNTKYIDDYREIQSKAQKQAIGIWSLENYASEDGFDSSQESSKLPASKNTEAATNGKCTIKGNINSSGDKIYHVESGRYYKMTKPEKWFCTEKEAVDAGFRKSQQ
ncbi:thermonuclease family protein [Fictibacillus barbaricus]|uniref:Micrococcal nuclease n=1 Tax=Fictibacillus barbaricus TaxID=182136 RepID=A0ABU1TXD6_9BACL|nr:thermonuclease family protein [Fictibacillus barbaricus]MDR7071880.1 micrococcal nuclease [Fictibacillus barbaricus]